MITGGGFVPSGQQTGTAVKFVFSCPLVLTATVCSPLTSTVSSDGMSNVSETSSILVIWELKVVNFWRLITRQWNFKTWFSSCCKSLGKFCPCLYAQNLSFHKVKATFRCPWEIINFSIPCCYFTLFLYHFSQNRGPLLHCSRIQVLTSHSTIGHWRISSHCFLLCLHLKKLSFMFPLLSDKLSLGGHTQCLLAALFPCSLKYLITVSFKLDVHIYYFEMSQEVFQ